MPWWWNQCLAWAQAEVEATLAALPAPLQAQARRVPVIYERLPSRDMQADGVADDTMGLFLGPAFEEEETTSHPLPPQIILYLENIWEEAGGDEKLFREETRITLLHELGHFLGLDEDDLTDRELD